jgi:hypothetical protein
MGRRKQLFKKALGLGVALVVGVMLVSASGAATTKAQKVTRIDVSTRAAVIHYLRSIHVNAKHAVIQRGVRNYAGAHCPSSHWTCASTEHTVVQIAKPGGQNRYACTSSRCVVVQVTGTEHGVYMAGRQAAAAPTKPSGSSATCVKTGSGATTGGGQTCAITQTGSGPNLAGVYENTMKVSGLIQTAQYGATITQTSSGSNGNTACVTQNISLDGSTSNTNGKATTVNLNAFQTILITQNSPSGPNSAQNAADSTGNCTSGVLTQSQTLTSTVSATGNITQNQDTATVNNQGNPAANVVTEIDQNQGSGFKGFASGLNNAAFTQTTYQSAIANAVTGKSVSQQQDANVPSPPYSGTVGTLNQDSSAKSSANVIQDETQCEDAANTKNTAPLTQCATTNVGDPPTGLAALSQTQYGPEGVFGAPAKQSGPVHYQRKGYGSSQQTGAGAGVVDSFNLQQNSHQYADLTSGQHQLVQGDCASSGNSSPSGGSCQAGQSATLNGENTSDGYTAGSIGQLQITCTNGHSSCTATPPPDPTLTATPPVDLNGDTTATSASFEFTDPARDATFNCTLDSVIVTPCGLPSVIHGLLDGTKMYTGLPLGSHTFTVTATDGSGNTSGNTATFTWTVVPPCTIGAGNTPLAYSSMPSDVVNCGPSSEGFEATSTNEFGDEVTLSTAGGTNLASMSVDFQSYGCSVSGHFNTGDCVSSTNDTFTIPGGITATIYSVGAGDTVGPPIATSTVNPNIPYRPSADNADCTGGDAGKWYDPIAAACRNSYPDVITFNNWTFAQPSTSFTNGEQVIWTVQFNTTHAGYTPIGESTACFASPVGCGYDSLNVGTKTYTNAATGFTTAAYAGTDVNEDVAFRSYDDPGYSGNVVPLVAETGWTGFRPLGKIVLGP